MAVIDDAVANLHVALHSSWLCREETSHWWDTIMHHVRWYRVKYKSARFGNECETPCWTAFFGGFPEFSPYEPVPAWLQPLVAKVSEQLQGAPFNSMLLRLYFDGSDEIAWHTDGREFLGETPTIASLSLGAAADFQMRRMTNVWPCAGTPHGGVDTRTPQRDFRIRDGDLLVMAKDTQNHWHHRVPKAPGGRRPRININFRYIIPGSPSSERGQQTYYKYMMHGDAGTTAPNFSYKDIQRLCGCGSTVKDFFGALATSTPAATAVRHIDALDSAPAEAEAEAGGVVPSSSTAPAPAAAASSSAVPVQKTALVDGNEINGEISAEKGTSAHDQAAQRPAKSARTTHARTHTTLKQSGPLDSFFTRM